MKISKLLSVLVSAVAGSLVCAALFSLPARAVNDTRQPLPSNNTTDAAAVAVKTHNTKSTAIDANGALSKTALKYAINGYQWAVDHNKVNNPQYLTVVNFSEPSYKRRMFVINLKTDRITMAMHVAQGKNTGAVYATRFSNRPGSLESSPGIFTTVGDQYTGEHGHSLRINGLEQGINSNALSRAVVIHPAWYVTPSFIKQNGYAGRSWGCFAVNPARIKKLVGSIEGGTVLFAYASTEQKDPRVAHTLSSNGEKIYHAILEENSSRLFA